MVSSMLPASSTVAVAAAVTAISRRHIRKKRRPSYRGRKKRSKTVKRDRSEVDDSFNDLSDAFFRRLYRMDKQSFQELLDILSSQLPSTGEGRMKGAVPNGPISHRSRLSMALRYFAGGDPLDIAWIHRVGDGEPLRSVWYVVDAIHATKSFNITFPQCHDDQLKVAAGFKKKSRVKFDNCAGAIDGMLVWIHKPTRKDMTRQGFGEMKCYCGRKKKFGLNMQAICDSMGNFLDIEIAFPGAASDYFAFHYSKIRKKLEIDGFLYPGLALYGDNAYTNTPYMVTPFRSVTTGPKDAFNYFHSQLRINIECAFGVLVHRWGILRKPIAPNIPIHKVSSLVLALCKLHNYCKSRDVSVPQAAEQDVTNIANDGGLLLPRMDNESSTWAYDNIQDRLVGLLDGGHHIDDQTEGNRRAYRRHEDLPFKSMLEYIELEGYTRPLINSTR